VPLATSGMSLGTEHAAAPCEGRVTPEGAARQSACLLEPAGLIAPHLRLFAFLA
jgi:hypothetical protein